MSKHYAYTLSGFALAGVLAVSSLASAATLLDVNLSGSASSTATSPANSSSTNIDTTLNTTLEINRANVGTSQSGEGSMSSSAVSTQDELHSYARAALRADASVEAMNFTKDKVEVKYKEKGRLLALLPVTFTVSARTHANGEVEIDYPWYSFLTVDNHDKVETEMKVAVDNALRARLVGSVKAEGESKNPVFTASESAMLAAEMQRVLKANIATNASASAAR